MCKMMIFKLVGQELSDLNVADIKPWVMHAEVAEKFLCYENRVILAGDAAHRFPPAGGFETQQAKSIFEEGKSLQLQFPAEDLGFRYLEGAIVPDEKSEAGDPGVPSGRRRDYVPCAKPGSRLPHMYVRILSDSKREVVSTLDLVSTEKVEFLLIISPLEDSYELARATFKVAKEFMANVKGCVIWPSSDDDGVERDSKSHLLRSKVTSMLWKLKNKAVKKLLGGVFVKCRREDRF